MGRSFVSTPVLLGGLLVGVTLFLTEELTLEFDEVVLLGGVLGAPVVSLVYEAFKSIAYFSPAKKNELYLCLGVLATPHALNLALPSSNTLSFDEAWLLSLGLAPAVFFVLAIFAEDEARQRLRDVFLVGLLAGGVPLLLALSSPLTWEESVAVGFTACMPAAFLCLHLWERQRLGEKLVAAVASGSAVALGRALLALLDRLALLLAAVALPLFCYLATPLELGEGT